MKPKKVTEPQKTWWRVSYRRTCAGTASVEAYTAEEAFALVESGDFEAHPGESQVDWEATGKARPE